MVVGHSKRFYSNRASKREVAWDRAQMIDQVNRELAARCAIPRAVWAANVIGSKMVPWEVSQLQRPMESVVDPVPNVASFVTSTGPLGLKLVCAGDYLTQSSFLGCVASALDVTERLVLGVIDTQL